MNYVPLHVHSASSPGWGVRTVEEICAAAKAMGLTRLALTDRNGLYAIPRFLAAAREHGLAPLVGAETVAGGHRAVLLARDDAGWANLCRLLSALHCDGGFLLPEALPSHREGLVVLSDDPAVLGPLAKARHEALFVELSPGHRMHGALALARERRLPPVATTRAVLLEAADLALHRMLRAIAKNTKLSRLSPEDTAREGDLLLPPAALADFFPHCPQALANTHAAAGLCRADWDLSSVIFPAYRGMREEEAVAELRRRAYEGAAWRLGGVDEKAAARLEKELGLIRKKGFSHYFLVVEELAKRSPRTCGRGSGAASLVAYCLGVTHVDPLRHNLFFERFLNEGRDDPPDIDIDFPWDERDEVLDFALARYGARRAAMVANQVGFSSRAARREVAKVLGVPPERLELAADPAVLAMAERLGEHLRHLSLHCGGLVVVPDEIRRLVPVEVSAKGLPVIQWEKDQAEEAGLVKIDILGNRSLAVIRDALAAVKGNGGPDIDYASWQPLDDAATRRLLRSGNTMGCFYIESPATRQLLQKMWGIAPGGPRQDPIPGGDGARGAEQEADFLFEHLVMASSIIRPAANDHIREFVARLRGKPWVPLHPLLSGPLDETYGIAIYQEQVTQMAMALAGFSPHEGDCLRKVLSKKHREKKLADYRERFLSGGRERGVPEEALAAAWEQILSFSGYSFCKPHSASYALVSVKSAFLKANHPAEFMAAVISNQGGFYSALAYLSECRRMGLSVLPPDVNQSAFRWTGRGREVRAGLMQIGHLTRKGSDALFAERGRSGAFAGFSDFLRRVPMDPEDIRLLVKAGCFDALETIERRPVLLWECLRFHQAGHGGRQRGRKGENGLLFEGPGPTPSSCASPPLLPFPAPCDEKTVLRQEVETLGLLLSRHPLTLYRRALARARPVPACELLHHAGRTVTLAGWWVTQKPAMTKRDEAMEFVTFEDTTGLFDATFFPRTWARFGRRLSSHRPWFVRGKVEAEFGVPTVTVEWIGPIEEG